MKKYILTLGLAALGATQVNAQSLAIGPEAGISLSTMSAKYNGVENNGEYLPGLKIGAVMDIGITPMISIQPGLYYQMKGYKNDFTNNIAVGGLVYQETNTATVRANYLEVPLNVQFNFDAGMGQFFVGVGPYAAFALGGKVESERVRILTNGTDGTSSTTTTSRELNIGDKLGDDIKSTDIGLNINTGYKWNSGLMVRGNAGFGLANLQPMGNDNNTLKNFSVALTIGYLFGI
jgi:hypothetical protein